MTEKGGCPGFESQAAHHSNSVGCWTDSTNALGEIPWSRRKGANKVLQLELSGNRVP